MRLISECVLYKVLGYGVYQGKSVTKLLLEPHSGRRHQLRLHALHIGHPIGTFEKKKFYNILH